LSFSAACLKPLLLFARAESPFPLPVKPCPFKTGSAVDIPDAIALDARQLQVVQDHKPAGW
jgi:hypothetical protein